MQGRKYSVSIGKYIVCTSQIHRMHQSKNNPNFGFTLIEVVIALAIFSMGLVTLLGMIPQNLDRMRKASSKSIERRIAQNIIGELMLNEWDRLHLFNSSGGDYRYFDAQGIELTGYSFDTIFTARVRVLPRDVNLDQDRSLQTALVSDKGNHGLPDDSSITKSTSQHARRVIVEVTDIPKENFDFDDVTSRRHFLTVGTVIANLNDVEAND
jgi:uncharacterized protein (TIGR02598 family)